LIVGLPTRADDVPVIDGMGALAAMLGAMFTDRDQQVSL
jgi:hypothetical protein